HKIDRTITRRFRADQTAAERQALTCESAGHFILEFAIHPIHVANFTATNTNIARRNIQIRADMTVKFRHEGLAKPHDFNVALAFGVEVRAAITAPHRQRGQRILEHLLEGQKFQDAQVDRWMKTDTAFVWPNGAVHLDAITAVDLDLAPIIDPSDPELNDPLRLQHPLQQTVLHVFGV